MKNCSFNGLSYRKNLFRIKSITGTKNHWIAVILIIVFLNLITGSCYYFKVNTASNPSAETISGLNNAGKTIIVHFNEKKWVLNDVDIKESKITGRISEYKNPPFQAPLRTGRPIRYTKRAAQDQRYLLNEVHLYVNEYNDSGNGMVTIPLKGVSRMDLYDKDTAATVGSWFLGSLGVAGGAFGIFIALVAIFKESCPFIYTWNGNDFIFAGEIYSGSIHKPLERNDYLKIPTYPGQHTYKLKITNEVREIQHTNLLELMVFDHPHDVEVLVDKYGKIRTLGQLLPPSKAVNLKGENIIPQIKSKDELYYQSSSAGDSAQLKDGIILEFPNRNHAKSAKLTIRAKNSIILDYTMRQLNDLFGYAYHHFQRQQQHATREELNNLALTQGIPLSLYVEREGKWEFADYFNIAGPMAFREDVLDIPLTGKEDDPLRLKLEYGNLLWEIDYVAVDYSPDCTVTSYTIPISSAFNEKQENVAGLLQQDDRKYYDQPESINQAVVTFDLPDITGEARTVILHSKGWYEVVQQPKGKPDFAYLKTFRNPGVFNRFTNEQVKKAGMLELRLK